MNDNTTTRGSGDESDRGQMAVLGFILLVGIVGIASIGLLVVGSDSVDQSNERITEEIVKQAFVQLKTDANTIARSRSNIRTTNFDFLRETDSAVRKENTGRMVIRQQLRSGGTKEIVNRSIGAIIYDGEAGHFAFQAGGVWQGTLNESRLVSTPSFSFASSKDGSSPTLTVPLIETSGATRLTTREIRLKKNKTLSPVNEERIVDGGPVTVRVQSKYYVAWAEYFRQLTAPRGVSVNHSTNTAIAKLVVPSKGTSIKNAVTSTVAGEDLIIDGNMKIDSYNSSNKSYSPATAGSDGSIKLDGNLTVNSEAKIDGNIDLTGKVQFNSGSKITGDVETGDDVTFYSEAKITGDVASGGSLVFEDEGKIDGNASYTDEFENEGDGVVTGSKNNITSTSPEVPEIEPIGPTVFSQINNLRNDNDNADESNIKADRLFGNTSCLPLCEIEPGRYYLSKLVTGSNANISSTGKIILNATAGNIFIAVDGDFKLDSNVEFVIQGDNRVSVYMAGDELSLNSNSKILILDNKAPLFWVYAPPGLTIKLESETQYNGVVYAPGTATDPGNLKMEDDSKIFGALVGSARNLNNEAQIHYDTALSDAEVFPRDISTSKLTFIHVSVYDICVGDDPCK
jgi:cytoskeletal protein CcmA (bactofilin family)